MSIADLRRQREIANGPETYSQRDFAAELDRDPRTIRRWTTAGLVARNPDGRYPRRELLRLLGLLAAFFTFASLFAAHGCGGKRAGGSRHYPRPPCPLVTRAADRCDLVRAELRAQPIGAI